MTEEARNIAIKAIVSVVGGVIVYVSGHHIGGVAAEETHAAKSAGADEAAKAVQVTLQHELQPLQADIRRLTSAVDTLWATRQTTEARLAALELPASATAADDWRQLPVQAIHARKGH